jgi:hypothetical protein
MPVFHPTVNTITNKGSSTWLPVWWLAVLGLLGCALVQPTCAFHFASSSSSVRHVPVSGTRSTSSSSSLNMVSISAHQLLYQDQQAAMGRRALQEEELLQSKKKLKELIAPKLKLNGPSAQSGTGFAANTNAANTNTKGDRLAAAQAKIVHQEGVVRINNVLPADLADRLRAHVLQQQQLAKETTTKSPELSQAFYGVEQGREHRCDLQLSLLRGGFKADNLNKRDKLHGEHDSDTNNEEQDHVLADTLQALLGKDGSLTPLYKNLVTPLGEFYEMAAIITNPGSHRQQIHPDLPFQKEAPLYVIFLALQTVTPIMGPTSFLLRTHTEQASRAFNDYSLKDDQLVQADCRLGTLQKGDAILFDARILHCGNANKADAGSTRVMFNFSFRNPLVQGNLGYDGSIRPGYAGAMNLKDMGIALEEYAQGNMEPFEQYGDGIVQV